MCDSSLQSESLQLLKEQASRLKLQTKEIELRDEQVRFLKETILALQQEKDILLAHNINYKAKIKQMATQIANYNANVVQKIYEENQELLRQVGELEQQLGTATQEKEEAIGRLRESEGRLQSHSSQKQELSTVNESLKEAQSKQEKRVALLEKENRQLQSKNISLQRQLDESSTQIAYCSQQIDVLTQKHHDALKIAEKKYKQAAEKLAPREQLQKTEKEVKDAAARNKQLRGDLQRVSRDNQKLKYELTGLRDRILSLQLEEETKSQQLRVDLANLSQSIKISKKIAQFQSQEHQIVSSIYDTHREMAVRCSALEEQIKNYAERLKSMEIQQKALSEEARFRELELQRVREAKEEQQQAQEAEYQHHLMELGLRLKKEEIALAGLRHKEDELEALREERQREVEGQRVQRDAMGRTIEELRKQNSRISEELSSAIKLCEENLLSRECITYYKYVVADLVGIACYLHLHLVRSRQRTLKLFKPFITYYLTIHPALAFNRRPTSRLKGAVWAVVAIIRMRRDPGKGKGLEWYAYCAGQRRLKLENLGQHIEMLSGTILSGGKAVDLLRSSQSSYKWKVNNYLKVRLPIGDDKKTISECELQLDQLD